MSILTTEYLILLMHSIGATTEQISGGLAVSKSRVKEVIAIELWEADNQIKEVKYDYNDKDKRSEDLFL